MQRKNDSQAQVDGHIPEWLSGDFISNGPAQFDIGLHGDFYPYG